MKCPTKCVFVVLFFLLTFGKPLGGQTPSLTAPGNPKGDEPPTSNVNPQFASRDARYHIGLGDIFELDFAKSPEFNQILTVQPDGYVSLRVVGDVKVVGQTIPELTLTIRKAYALILHDPRIAIGLKDFEKPYFVAGGWLEKPGKYDLRGETTVSQAIQIAGGMKEGARSSQVFLFRSRDNDWFEVKKLNLKRFASGKDFSEDVHLRPGDMILVRQSSFSKIAPYLPRSSVGAFFDPQTLF